MYTVRTNGAIVQEKYSSIVFRYSHAELEFGRLQASELKEHLEGLMLGWPLSVLEGKDYIEVRPKGLHKGYAIQQVKF